MLDIENNIKTQLNSAKNLNELNHFENYKLQSINENGKKTNYECNNILDALEINTFSCPFSLFSLSRKNNYNTIHKTFTFSKSFFESLSISASISFPFKWMSKICLTPFSSGSSTGI